MQGRLKDKRKKFHITVNQWKTPPIHPLAEVQFICQETGEQGNKHTHIGVLLAEKISGCNMLKWAKTWSEGEPDIAWHNKWSTIVGYHYGAGGKETCPGVIWQKGAQFEDAIVKRKYSYKVIQKANNIEELQDFIVRPGMISGLIKDWNYLKIPKAIKPPRKDRHYIICDKPNTGKSQMIALNFKEIYMKVPDKWWDNYERQKIIWCEESYPPWTETKKWTNGSGFPVMVEIKGGTAWLRPDAIFFITCNTLPWSEYMEKNPMEMEALKARFKVVNAKEFREEMIEHFKEEAVVYCQFCKEMKTVKEDLHLHNEYVSHLHVEKGDWELTECELKTLWAGKNNVPSEPIPNTLPAAPNNTPIIEEEHLGLAATIIDDEVFYSMENHSALEEEKQ